MSVHGPTHGHAGGEPALGGPVAPGEPVTVLYVAGSGRSGSTIVANTLGQIDGLFDVGELWNVWRRGLIEHRRCGCGRVFDSCPLWGEVLRRAFGHDLDRGDAERLDTLTLNRLRTRGVRAVLEARRTMSLDGDEYRIALAALYRALRSVTGCRVVVDSSKCSIYASLLATIPGLRLHVVHLVRDARAAAFSNSRVRALPDFGDGRLMRRQRPLTTARRWAKGNVLADSLLPGHVSGFINVRYEDFVRRPAATLERIVSMTGEPARLPLSSASTVRLSPTHSVSGNPSRFRSGDVELRLDDEWVTAMRDRDRAAVTALTWPLLLRYRYPLRVT